MTVGGLIGGLVVINKKVSTRGALGSTVRIKRGRGDCVCGGAVGINVREVLWDS